MANSMAITIVSSAEELVSALKTMRGGETILLADGNYGSLILDTAHYKTLDTYSETVTIAALNPGRASFSMLDVRAATNLAIDGLDVGNMKVQNASKNITITNNDIGSLFLRNVDGLELANNDVGGSQFGVIVHAVSNAVIRGNYIHHASEDLMRIIGGSSNVLVEDNLLYDTVSKPGVHSDLIQTYGYGGVSPEGITIRGNILYDDPTTGSVTAQGIFMSDPQGAGYKDILVEQNLIYAYSPNGLYIVGGEEDVLIQDNTMIGLKGSMGAMIRVAARSGWTNSGVTVDGNVARVVLNEMGGTIGDNYRFGTGAYYTASKDQTQIFESPRYIGWESFLPVAGSEIDFGSNYGAQERLKELLRGVDDHFGPNRIAFEAAGPHSFKSANSWLDLDDGSNFRFDEGTVALSFKAMAVNGLRGILSKDSAGLNDGLSIFIHNGVLNVRFEDDSSQTITSRVAANKDYDLVLTFGNGKAQAWLNGSSIGTLNTDMDWTHNREHLVLGAFNNNSAEGDTNNLGYVMDGTIKDLQIYDNALDPDEAVAITSRRSAYLDASTSPGDWSKVALYDPGKQVFTNSTSKAVVYDNDPSLAIDEGTVVLNFSTDVTSWYHGIVSRNSRGLDHGFNISTFNDVLSISFEDDDGIQTISKSGIQRFKDYNLIASFEDGVGEVWLDGTSIGRVSTDMDWRQNDDKIVLGALNTNSNPGTTSSLVSPYDGQINGFMVLKEGMTAAEVWDYVDATPTMII